MRVTGSALLAGRVLFMLVALSIALLAFWIAGKAFRVRSVLAVQVLVAIAASGFAMTALLWAVRVWRALVIRRPSENSADIAATWQRRASVAWMVGMAALVVLAILRLLRVIGP